MITALLQFLITAATIYFAGKYMKKVHVESFGVAMLVAFSLAVLNFLIGWLLMFVLHLATLGLFWITGLQFIIAIIVNAIIIEVIDRFSSGFRTDGFAPSLWLALIIALVNAVVFALL